MNNGRADALLQWANSVTGSNVQHLKEFSNTANVDILVNVLRLTDKDNNNIIPNNGTLQHKISYMISHLEGIYHCIDNIISIKSITEGNELEIGKLISLLLYGAVQGNNVQYFIERIHQLENRVQYHLKAIIETMLYNMEKGGLTAKSFNKLLQETETFKDGQQFHNMYSPGPVFSPSIANSPAETVYSNSPFMTLMLSPQMKNKQNQFMTNKLHQKVKTLQVDLDTQHHLQTTLEDELADRNQEIDTKGAKIRELQKELVQVKMVVDELESLQHFKNDYEKSQREINKLKQRVAELENFKEQNANLQDRTQSFLKEKDAFEKQMEETELMKAKCERYRQQLHHLEFQGSELQAALNRREEEMTTIVKERDEALNAASESTELWRSRRLPEPEEDEEEYQRFEDSLMPMDSMAPNQESRIIELEFQNERLKKRLASSIDPGQLQQMKDRLDDVGRSKKSYEEKFVEAKSKILSIEDNLAQVQDQSRIRQEALQRKIDDSDRTLSATKEKLQQSRTELSRVQSELMVSRGEVEAHVIAMEKQRVTTSRAMDDMAAERKTCEEEAKEKLNELCKELEVKERQTLENCHRMSKEYDTKLRHITEELQTIHKKDREEMQQKITSVSKQRDNLKTDFSIKQEELQRLLQKAEKETIEVRDVYENMLAELKHELERFAQIEKTLNANEDILKNELEEYKVVAESLKTERSKLSFEVTTLKESESKLLKEKTSLESAIISAKEKEAMLLEEKALEISYLKLEYSTELESIIEKFENENKTSTLEMKKANDYLNRKIEEANQQISKLNEENEDKIKCIESMNKKLAKTEERKEQQVNKLNEEINKQAKASEEEIAKLKAENEAKVKEFYKEMIKKDETTKQVFTQLKNDSENEIKKQAKASEEEIAKLKAENEAKVEEFHEEMVKKDETTKQVFTQLRNDSENEIKKQAKASEEEIAKLKAENEAKVKEFHKEMIKKDETTKQVFTQLKNDSENEIKKQAKASEEEIAKLKAENEAKVEEFHKEMVKKDEIFKQETMYLMDDHEHKMKLLTEEMVKKDETAKQEMKHLVGDHENKMAILHEEMIKKDETTKQETMYLMDDHEHRMKLLTEEMVKKDETAKQEMIHLVGDHENKMAIVHEEMIKKDETAKQVFTQLKNDSENEIKELKKETKNLTQYMSERDVASGKEIANRDKSLEELTQSFTKLKQVMDATEARLLDITRERNQLEKELAKEANVRREKLQVLSFQKEQMKAEHSKVVQEMMSTLQEERKNHKKENKDFKDQLDKACHGLKVAADNIEEFKATIEELEQKVATERSRVKTFEVELDKVREDSKDKQKKMFEDAAKKNGAMEEAYETDRNNWKKKLDIALEENMVLRSEMFENSQKHSAEMMESRRRVQGTEDRAAVEEKKLREEIRGFIGMLANERVTNNDLNEKLQHFEGKERELSQSLDSREKTLNEVKEKLEYSENKGRELLQSLAEKEKTLQEKTEDLQAKETTRIEELEKLRNEFETEKNIIKKQAVEQVQERTKEAEQLQQEVEEFQKKVEQMSVDFEKEREASKTEFQNELQKQASSQDEHVKEIGSLKSKVKAIEDSKEKEAEEMKVKVEEAKKELDSEIKELKMKLEESTSSMKNLQEDLVFTTKEREKVVSKHEESEETWKTTENELKNKLTELEDGCKVLREKQESLVRDEEEVKVLTEFIEKLGLENTEFEEQLQEERATNRRLGTQVNSLEAQVKHADRTIREKNQTLQKIQSQSDDVKRSNKHMLIDVEKVFPVETFQEYLDQSSSTDEEPLMKIDELRSGNSTSLSSTNSDLSKTSTSLNSLHKSSLRSTVRRTAANRRQSAIYLKGNTPPAKRTTASAAFFIVGDEFAKDMEQEPLDYEYDWERLAELERRNTICKPHMKTSYPIETQTRPDENKNKTLLSSVSDSGYRTRLKRKSADSAASEISDPKLRKEQPNSKSEGHLKRSKSKRIAEKLTSKINSLRSKSNENIAKDAEKQKGGSGNGVAFSIDITPPSKKSKDNSVLKLAASKTKEPTKEKEATTSKLAKKDSMAFTIANSPPKKIDSELKPKRQRTINRSTASTRLVFEKDKEVCKEAKQKQYLSKTNRKPLRSANTKN